MSKVDEVFGPIPGPLIQEWGTAGVFIKAGTSTYDPVTGVVTPSETRYDVKVVICELDISEDAGLYQKDDVKLLIDPGQIGGSYISTSDYFEIQKAGVTQTMKVVDPRTYRGTSPVFFVVIARPQ
jgi:hypothetical protein